jgi:diguanylate cyclase (GGDEF)-like protein
MPKEIFYLHQLWMFSAFSFGVMTALILEKNNKRIFLDARKLEQLATIDKLSGLYNRMKIENYCEMEIDKVKRYNEVFSVILIDIDYFKEINDDYGHNIGDRVISSISKILQSSIRRVDYVGRWGGEEFLILLPKTTAQQAFQIAEKIRITIMEEDFSPAQNITISAGITEYMQGDTTEKIIQRADEELYKAKESGRNQIQIYEASSFL